MVARDRANKICARGSVQRFSAPPGTTLAQAAWLGFWGRIWGLLGLICMCGEQRRIVLQSLRTPRANIKSRSTIWMCMHMFWDVCVGQLIGNVRGAQAHETVIIPRNFFLYLLHRLRYYFPL